MLYEVITPRAAGGWRAITAQVSSTSLLSASGCQSGDSSGRRLASSCSRKAWRAGSVITSYSIHYTKLYERETAARADWRVLLVRLLQSGHPVVFAAAASLASLGAALAVLALHGMS